MLDVNWLKMSTFGNGPMNEWKQMHNKKLDLSPLPSFLGIIASKGLAT
jgi:hypothetical protein